MYALKCIVLTLSFCVASLLLWAQPNLSNIVSAGGLSCYRDVNNPDLIYYPPGELSVVTDRQGKSDFNFLQMRYTGNIVYSDQGDSRFTSFVRFRVKMKRISQNTLEEIQNEVWGEGKKGELRPLPISDIRSTLIFTPIELDKTDTLLASNCTITAEDKDGLSKRGTYWKEREFSLRLDNNSTQSLWDAFDKGNTLMSLSYSFFSRGINATNNEIETKGDGTIAKIANEIVSSSNDSAAVNSYCVKSDAFSITIDTDKWPDLLKKIDINEQVPPGYAALEIRCYDFNNNLRPDLYAKTLEVKAEGVGRGEVKVLATFNKNNPDVYVQYIRFPYAVKLDKLPKYRIKSISDDTPPITSEWVKMDTWTKLIDITSSEEEIPVLEE